MDEYTDATYGDRVADVYDDWYADLPTLLPIETTVGFLRDLAGAGPALELGIGTGRIALPLSWSGVTVRGIDASDAMVAKLASKAGAENVAVTVSSFADFDLGARFGLIYVSDELRIDVAELDNANQRVDTQHLVIVDGQLPRVYPIQFRFAYHPELDLMARLAGMRLRERWGDWDRSPFTGNGKHISVWELDR